MPKLKDLLGGLAVRSKRTAEWKEVIERLDSLEFVLIGYPAYVRNYRDVAEGKGYRIVERVSAKKEAFNDVVKRLKESHMPTIVATDVSRWHGKRDSFVVLRFEKA